MLVRGDRVGHGARALRDPESRDVGELAVEVEPPEPAAVAAEPHGIGSAGARAALPGGVRPGGSAPHGLATEVGDSAGSAAASAPAEVPRVLDHDGGEGWSFSVTRPGSVDLSLGARRYQVPIPDASQAGAGTTERDVAKRLFAATTERDNQLGLGRGGPVRSAIEEAVRSERGLLGAALFEVTLDHAGVVRVDLVESGGDGASWDRLRDPVARLVAARPVRLPENGRGLRVSVRVEAVERLADGRSVGSLGGGVHASAGQVGTESVAMKEMPNVGIEHRGKVCSGRLSVSPTGDPSQGPLPAPLTPLTFGGGCSPENIGVAPRRVVAARVVGETQL